MRIVVAPDSFKGSLGAADVAAALADGWRDVRPGDELACVPLADGGEGTLEVLAAAAPAPRWHRAAVTGPGRGGRARGGQAGEKLASCWLELGTVGCVELARASGLPLLPAPDPLGAQTVGTGELITRALDGGARALVVALGGSASTDGGTGALAALGARFLDAAGRDLPPGGGALRGLAAADLSGLRPPPPGGVVCLADVHAPLLGPEGAAAVFGPQKGADADQVAVLEAGLARLADVLGGDPGAPGAGAAGGAGYGFAAAWGADITPGAAELCRVTGLDAKLAGAGLIITGEGRYDATSARGKVTGTVLAAAARAAVPAALVAGVIAADPPPAVAASVALALLAGGAAAAIEHPARWLRSAGQVLARELGAGAPRGGARSGRTGLQRPPGHLAWPCAGNRGVQR